MIPIERGPKPVELDDAMADQLTTEFAEKETSVWNKPFIRNALLAASHSKCAYCECNIAEESKYMEVDHFRPKKTHPSLVVKWENLLPSCKRCNVNKLDHDVDVDGMIVDPSHDDPNDYLYFSDLRLRYKNDIGKRTITTCNLNQTDRLYLTRAKLAAQSHETLEHISDLVDDYLSEPKTNRKRNRILRSITNVLETAQPTKPYAAFLSTIILSDQNYIFIKNSLVDEGIWASIEPLEATVRKLVLQI